MHSVQSLRTHLEMPTAVAEELPKLLARISHPAPRNAVQQALSGQGCFEEELVRFSLEYWQLEEALLQSLPLGGSPSWDWIFDQYFR